MRLVLVVPAILLVTAALIPVQWIAVRLGLPLRRKIPTVYHRLMCRLVGVRLTVIGRAHDARPLMIVANHVSWLDISVITAVAPVVFVAKAEVAGWPLFGLLARLQRSVFVDRRRRQQTGAVNAAIAQRLSDGDPVVLFGEGTSGDGNRVLPFRTALIGAAREALGAGQAWLQPLSLAYTGLLGLPLGRQHRPRVAWYGDFEMLPHLVGILKSGGVDVTVTWGEAVAVDAGADRKAAARRLEDSVRRTTALALRGRAAQPAGAQRESAAAPP